MRPVPTVPLFHRRLIGQFRHAGLRHKSELPLSANREHVHLIVQDLEPIERDEARLPVRNDELAQLAL